MATVKEVTPADIELVERLHMLTRGLPGELRVKYFRNSCAAVHELAADHMLRGESYEAALHHALFTHLPHPNCTNLKLFWRERHDLPRYLGWAMLKRVTSVIHLLTRRYQAITGKLPLPFGSLEKISGYEQLQTDIAQHYPNKDFRWEYPNNFGPTCTYVGCAEAEGETLYVLSDRIRDDVNLTSQVRLAQLGQLIDELTYRQSFYIYKAVPDRFTETVFVKEVHNQFFYWNKHEALSESYKLNLPHALAAEFWALCRAWWQDQKRPPLLVVKERTGDHAADMRAMLPIAELWEDFGFSPEEGTPYVKRTPDTFKLFGRVVRLPYINPFLLSAILSFLLLPLTALISLLPTALILILILSLSPVAGFVPGFLVSSLFLLLVSASTAAVLADRLVSAITLRSPLTTPHHGRERAYVK